MVAGNRLSNRKHDDLNGLARRKRQVIEQEFAVFGKYSLGMVSRGHCELLMVDRVADSIPPTL